MSRKLEGACGVINGVNDNGTGSMGWQYNEYMGLMVKFPAGFCSLVENVFSVRP